MLYIGLSRDIPKPARKPDGLCLNRGRNVAIYIRSD